jgi:hypothetical protein
MKKKVIWYLIPAIGLAVFIASLSAEIAKAIPYIDLIPESYLMPAGIAIIILGLIPLLGKKKIKETKFMHQAEVPIFQGGKVIGYRRD